jgi:transmembrane sensor
MQTSTNSEVHDRIHDEAAEWSDRLRHRGGQPGLREAFERWRAQSPAHADAFASIDAVNRLGRAARDSDAMAELEAETMARIAAGGRTDGRRRSWAIAAGLAVGAVAGLFSVQDQWGEWRHLPEQARYALVGDTVYRTAVGEQRRITLDDGTVLTLNTGSRVAVQYRERRRSVVLLDGQALFEVAHDKTRPFVVTAGERTVTALGTAFDVRLSREKLEVVLIEGSVAVEPGTADVAPQALAAERIVLIPGERLTVAAAEPQRPVVRKADVQRAVSWKQGQLIFRNDRLADAVEEVNRYSKRQIVLTDEALGALRISGIVNTGKTEVFVETMTSYYPVRIAEASDERVVLAPRS